MRYPLPVLVVSSDMDTQDACILFLRNHRIPAIGASSIDDALLLLRESRVAAVLVDVIIEADWSACAVVCSHLPPTIPVIVLTAWISPDRVWREKARRIGCAGFLAKPCSPETVRDALAHVMDGEAWIERTGAA